MIRRVAALASFTALAACAHADRDDLQTLETLQGLHDPRLVASSPVACRAAGDPCREIHEIHGNACLQQTEADDMAARAAMRQCAVNDYREALAQSPPASDRLADTRQFSEALRIDRDNNPQASQRSADRDELDRMAGELDRLPDGAAYGHFYSANNALNRVLNADLPPGQSCAMLRAARGKLQEPELPPDIAPRAAELRVQLDGTSKSQGCQ